MNKLVKYWYTKHPLLLFLLPFSYLYLLITKIRHLTYVLGIKKSFRFNLPIIVVGNLTVGGTGKTPLIIELAKLLKENGYHPGVVSRGYKSKATTFPQWVTKDSDPGFVGDEPLLMAKKTDCPVVIAPKRCEAVKLLLEKASIDLVLSDDGLQHHALKRDVEIVVMDDRNLGNGFYLPAGPLRESAKRLKKVDFIIYNGDTEADYHIQVSAGKIYNLLNPKLILTPANQVVHAVAGIGNPQRFFSLLRQLNFQVVEHCFPDHYAFKAHDICFPEAESVIMTEKDAIKCQAFARSNHWVLPISLKINERFAEQFLAKLASLQLAKSA